MVAALLGRATLMLAMVAILAGGRFLVARAAGVATARFPFRDGPTRAPMGAGEILMHAVSRPIQVQIDMTKGIASFLFGRTEGELAGPVGIVKETARFADRNPTADVLAFLGAFVAYAWPVFLLTALVIVPRKRRRSKS